MRFIQLKTKLTPFGIFSLADIRSLEPDFDSRRLTEWQQKGYIKKIIRGIYIFSDIAINEETLFLVANGLLSPSYVSLESALSWYGLIPEGVMQITSVSTIRTIQYDTAWGSFSYRTIKPQTFWGDTVVNTQISARSYRIASLPKALLDLLYLRTDLDSIEAINELRLNTEVLQDIDQDELTEKAKYFGNKKFEQRVLVLKEFIQHA